MLGRNKHDCNFRAISWNGGYNAIDLFCTFSGIKPMQRGKTMCPPSIHRKKTERVTAIIMILFTDIFSCFDIYL